MKELAECRGDLGESTVDRPSLKLLASPSIHEAAGR
jgi:hypothetical protein